MENLCGKRKRGGLSTFTTKAILGAIPMWLVIGYTVSECSKWETGEKGKGEKPVLHMVSRG